MKKILFNNLFKANTMRQIGLVLLCAIVWSAGLAQDAHYSQYFMSPLYTNPALTGQINGNYRVNSLYRTQWNTFGDAYTTSSLSGDMRIKEFGVGVSFVDQFSGENGFNTLEAVVSGAYDLAFKNNTGQHLVFGVQLGLINKSFRDKNVSLPDQYIPGFGAIGAKNEDFDGLSAYGADINFGVLWFNGSSNLSYTPFVGAAAFHLAPVNESFEEGGEKATLPRRYLVHGGVRYRTESAIDITPHAQAMLQKDADNAIVGVNVSYGLIDTYTRIEGGLSYRVNDAAVAYLGAIYKDFQLGVSYDFNISSLSDHGRLKNSLEFSLTYINKKKSYKQEFICPRL